MQYVMCDVSTMCMGMAASMGAFLLAGGTKGKRFALPNSTIMIHQPSAGTQGQITDMAIHLKRLEVVKKVVMTLVLILTIPHSVLAVTWGLSAMAFFEMILNFGATPRYAGLTAGRFLRTLLPIASATAAMFGVVWAFGHFTSFAPLPTFLLKVAVGVVCYAGFGALFRLEAMRVAWELVKKLFR